MQASSIEIENLAKGFFTLRGKVTALKKVDLKINPGEFFVLLGPSGCGKSTLLNLIAGLEKPSQGSISFSGQLAASPKKSLPPFKRDLSFVFQSYALYPHFTVEGNIAFPLKNQRPKLSKQEIKRKVLESARTLKIEELLDRKPGELSGGQRQRVAIGRAIVRSPKAFLMDEPLSNLDAQLRMEMRAQLKDLQHKLGITTIYVTHDQIEAMTLGDRIAVMDKGLIQQTGSPKEVYSRPRNVFTARFIGSPPMNILKGEIQKKGNEYFFQSKSHCIQLPLEKIDQIKAASSHNVYLGLRPEEIQICPAEKAAFSVKIDVAENTGPEYLLYSLGEEKITLKSSDSISDTQVHCSFQPKALHLFDKEGKRIE